MDLKNAQSEEEVSHNIQLGIFIPQGVHKKKKKEELQAAVVKKNGQKKGQLSKEEMPVHRLKDIEKTSRKRTVKFEEVEDGHLKKNKVSATGHMSSEEGPDRTKQKKVRTRRRVKTRRAKNAKRKLSQAGHQLTETGMDRDIALDYLRQWDSDRSKWTFRKKSQYWLLQNACDKSQVSLSLYIHVHLALTVLVIYFVCRFPRQSSRLSCATLMGCRETRDRSVWPECRTLLINTSTQRTWMMSQWQAVRASANRRTNVLWQS